MLAIFIAFAARSMWISDDGYIYLTYVQNLTDNGDGAVFNAGERVEGFTSPAWFAIVSFANLLRPAGLLTLRQLVIAISLCVSCAAALSLVALNRAAEAHDDAHVGLPFGVNLPLALFAGMAVFHAFATSGLETPLVFLYVCLFGLFAVRPPRELWQLALFIGSAPLVRPDLSLLGAALLIYLIVARALPLRRAVKLASLSTIPALVLETARVIYYQALLPNTAYAKVDSAVGTPEGARYLTEFVLSYGFQWIALAAVLATLTRLWVRRAARPIRRAGLLYLFTALAYGAYVVKVGGDFMHGRFWIPCALLVMFSLIGIGRRAAAAALGESATTSPVRSYLAVTSMPLIVCAVALTNRPMATWLGDGNRPKDFHGIANEYANYRFHNANLSVWSGDNLHRWYGKGEALGQLSRLLDTEVGVASGPIGQLSFAGQQDGGRVYVYDIRGLTQPVTARIDMGGRHMRTGHARLAPMPLSMLNPRVDFSGNPNWPGYNEAFGIRVGGYKQVLANPDLLDALASAGVITPARVKMMMNYLRAKLAEPAIDANFVYFLSERYHRDDELRRLIGRHHEATRPSRWEAWLITHAKSIGLLRNHRSPPVDVARRLDVAFAAHAADPITYLPPGPDWRVNELIENAGAWRDLLDDRLWGSTRRDGVDVSWSKEGFRWRLPAGATLPLIWSGDGDDESQPPEQPLCGTAPLPSELAVLAETTSTKGMTLKFAVMQYVKGKRIRSAPLIASEPGVIMRATLDKRADAARIALGASGKGHVAVRKLLARCTPALP